MNRTVLQNYKKRPDAGCVSLQGKRLDCYVSFAEVKPDYKKKDTVKTHEDLLRLSLFGMNALEEYNPKYILLMQVIGKMKLDANSIFLVKLNVILQYRA